MQYAPIMSQKCTGSGVTTMLGRLHCHQRDIGCHIFMRVIIGDPELRVIEWCSPWPCPGVRLVLSSAHSEDARPGTSVDGKCRPVPGQPEDGLDLSAGDNWFSTSPSVSTSPDRTGQFKDQG